jgi:hypothetical protein
MRPPRAATIAATAKPTREDVMTKSHNQNTYYTYLRVTDEVIKPTENANPVKTLRVHYDEWRKAGAKPFNAVPTVATADARP